MQYCIALHFAQFCTVHNFQIYLEHLWADFQSCSDDDGRDELILIAVMMTTEMVSPSFKGFSVNFGQALVFPTSTVPGAQSSYHHHGSRHIWPNLPSTHHHHRHESLIHGSWFCSIYFPKCVYRIFNSYLIVSMRKNKEQCSTGTFWFSWPLTRPLSSLPTSMWNSTDLDLFQTSGESRTFADSQFIKGFLIAKYNSETVFLPQLSIYSPFHGFCICIVVFL